MQNAKGEKIFVPNDSILTSHIKICQLAYIAHVADFLFLFKNLRILN